MTEIGTGYKRAPTSWGREALGPPPSLRDSVYLGCVCTFWGQSGPGRPPGITAPGGEEDAYLDTGDVTLEPETKVIDRPGHPALARGQGTGGGGGGHSLKVLGVKRRESWLVPSQRAAPGVVVGGDLCWRSLQPVSTRSRVQTAWDQGPKAGRALLFLFTGTRAPVTTGKSSNQVTGRRLSRQNIRSLKLSLWFFQVS